MFNWKVLSVKELEKELRTLKRKDLKKLKLIREEIEKEENYVWGEYIEAEGEEETNKWEKQYNKISDKWDAVRETIGKLENGKNMELIMEERD